MIDLVGVRRPVGKMGPSASVAASAYQNPLVFGGIDWNVIIRVCVANDKTRCANVGESECTERAEKRSGMDWWYIVEAYR